MKDFGHGVNFLHPGEWCYEWCDGWVSREAVPNPEDAVTIAAKELDVDRAWIELVPVLMREPGEVECRINGWDEGCMVECTGRAKTAGKFWRVVVSEVAAPASSERRDG